MYNEFNGKAGDLSKCKIGDIVKFGRYPQTENGEEKPIEWIVLDRDADKALLISKYGLDSKSYNDEFDEVTWETSTLREWLNDDFAPRAFDAGERACIVVGTVKADKNPGYETYSGNDSTDGIFLLSIPETQKYFATKNDRVCYGTAYCFARGALRLGNDHCCWWLRSPGEYRYSAAGVNDGGRLIGDGFCVSTDGNAVRPALWIKMSS